MSQGTPLISVVIPVYNHEKFIAQSLESVISQTYTNLQILVSDDKSTDNSLAVIWQYAAKDKRIEILEGENNLGICGNFNRLFDNVKGEFVAFFSGDDIMVQDKLEKQYQVFKDDNNVMVVHHNAWMVDSEGRKTGTHLGNTLPLYNPLDWALKADWFHAKRIAPLLPTTCLARSEYYLNARYDRRLKYKHELLFTIKDYCKNPNGKWAYLREPLLLYRTHEANFTNNKEFTSFLDEEKFKLHDLAIAECPALEKRLTEYKLFVCYEKLLFGWYKDGSEKIGIDNYFADNASFLQKAALMVASALNRAGLYWPMSKLVHRVFYRPFYQLKYSGAN